MVCLEDFAKESLITARDDTQKSEKRIFFGQPLGTFVTCSPYLFEPPGASGGAAGPAKTRFFDKSSQNNAK